MFLSINLTFPSKNKQNFLSFVTRHNPHTYLFLYKHQVKTLKIVNATFAYLAAFKSAFAHLAGIEWAFAHLAAIKRAFAHFAAIKSVFAHLVAIKWAFTLLAAIKLT